MSSLAAVSTEPDLRMLRGFGQRRGRRRKGFQTPRCQWTPLSLSLSNEKCTRARINTQAPAVFSEPWMDICK